MTMQFIPQTHRIIVKSADGKYFNVNAELLTSLRSDLGDAARAAVDHPGVAFKVADSQRIYR